MNSPIKHQLYKHCKSWIDDRINHINEVLCGIKESLQGETKSSAGDKHETGRAMLQLEEENNNRQLGEALKLRDTLLTINPDFLHSHAMLGSLIITNQANYFISISAGKVSIKNKLYYCVSAGSPIGQVIFGKQAGQVVLFNGAEIQLLEIY